MSFKRWFVLFLFMASLAFGETALVDKIAAVVNDEIITLSDIHKAIQLFPIFRNKNETENSFFNRVLVQLINYKVIYLEYSDEFQLGEEDFEEVQTPILEKAGSLEQLNHTLDQYGMEWQDFKYFIREKVLYEIVIQNRFQTKITIPYPEIEQFYQQEYLPVQKKLGIKARSLIEMAPLIEKHLRTKKIDRKLKEWLDEIKTSYQIENILIKENSRTQSTQKPEEHRQ